MTSGTSANTVMHRQAKGRECSLMAHIYIPNPRTNKQTTSVDTRQKMNKTYHCALHCTEVVGAA